MTSEASDASGQYWRTTPAVASRASTVDLVLPDLTLALTTDRGVFSKDRIDTGSKLLLLESRPPDEARTIVDLGCGYGPLALATAMRRPAATVYAVDVNQRAIELCRANADAAGLTNVRVGDASVVPPVAEVDYLISNPPIRIGKAALHELLTTWLDRLTPSGVAHLVVQRHLGADSLARWLDDNGHATTRRASRKGYRVIEVAARARPADR